VGLTGDLGADAAGRAGDEHDTCTETDGAAIDREYRVGISIVFADGRGTGESTTESRPTTA